MAPPPLPVDLSGLVGRLLKNQYRLEAKIGQGGMGAVFRAVNEALGKIFAVKVLYIQAGNLVNKPDAEARFSREIKLASKMSHPHIAQVFDCGVEYGFPYMVMEYIEGEGLDKVIQEEKPVTIERVLEIMRQLALALEEAERCGIVHRDIKPENIRLQRYKKDGPIYLKVLDFGLAKSVQDEQDQLTTPGTIMGSVSYMAPEQISPDVNRLRRSALGHSSNASTLGPQDPCPQAIDGRADLYSAGVILYYLLAGELPFKGEMTVVLAAHLFQDPAPLPETVPRQLASIANKLLQKDPAARFQTATELLVALKKAEDPVSVLSSPNPIFIPAPVVPPSVWPKIGLVVALISVPMVGGVIALRGYLERTPANDLSQSNDLEALESGDLLPASDLANTLDVAAPRHPPDLSHPPSRDMAKPKKPKPDLGVPRPQAFGTRLAVPKEGECKKDELERCIMPHSSEFNK